MVISAVGREGAQSFFVYVVLQILGTGGTLKLSLLELLKHEHTIQRRLAHGLPNPRNTLNKTHPPEPARKIPIA